MLNTFVVFAYFGFWNVAMYVWKWGTRKFNPKTNPTLPRFLHNMFYSFLGCVQWTVWECAFVYAYATGRLGYISDEQALSSWPEVLRTFAAILFVPLWRDFHFYFTHRFLHMRFLYKYVHSLHHRNTDIEPFSGLCMVRSHTCLDHRSHPPPPTHTHTHRHHRHRRPCCVIATLFRQGVRCGIIALSLTWVAWVC
jgi:sterol desaturase/sphingolipid hydroxylase (fatty acid hydroxylase superfamily)